MNAKLGRSKRSIDHWWTLQSVSRWSLYHLPPGVGKITHPLYLSNTQIFAHTHTHAHTYTQCLSLPPPAPCIYTYIYTYIDLYMNTISVRVSHAKMTSTVIIWGSVDVLKSYMYICTYEFVYRNICTYMSPQKNWRTWTPCFSENKRTENYAKNDGKYTLQCATKVTVSKFCGLPLGGKKALCEFFFGGNHRNKWCTPSIIFFYQDRCTYIYISVSIFRKLHM